MSERVPFMYAGILRAEAVEAEPKFVTRWMASTLRDVAKREPGVVFHSARMHPLKSNPNMRVIALTLLVQKRGPIRRLWKRTQRAKRRAS